MPTLVAGQIVEAKYRVVRALAAGGFGAVYEVFREGLKQRGAMKVLTLNPSPEMVQRIHNEARALGALRHPNIPQIYDMGSFPDGAPWLVMEFLEGESLEARLIRAHKSGQRGLPFADVMEIGEDITAAMNAAHEKGVIHRDMKPSNVVLVADAKASCGLRAVVLDFGIARMAGDGLTQTGALLGTPAYMAPEQAVDARQADAQSDVYAVGMVLYQSLCGRLPFDIDPARGPYGVLLAKAMPPEPLSQYAPHVPAEIQTLIMRTLERDPSQRPSMGDLEEALGRYRPPRRTGKTSSTHVVAVNPPRSSRPQWGEAQAALPAAGDLGRSPLDDDEEDPTASVSEAVVPLPSLSASLLQSETPSEQRVRGEISPGRDAPPVVVPQSISDVPSRPTALPPLKASPDDRTAQPAPTQGIPAEVASPAARTAPAVMALAAGAPVATPPKRTFRGVLLPGAALLSVSLTALVLLWPHDKNTAVQPKPTTLAGIASAASSAALPASSTATPAPPPPKSAASTPAAGQQLTPEIKASADSSEPGDAMTKGKRKPATRCVPLKENCLSGSLKPADQQHVFEALREAELRVCTGERLTFDLRAGQANLIVVPSRIPSDEREALRAALRGRFHNTNTSGSVSIHCP